MEENKQEEKETVEEPKKTKKSKKFKQNISGFFSDFKKFISKGNIIDLSVAVVIGAAFNKIVSSLVNFVIMPLISLLMGGVSVADWKWVIKPATYDAAGNIITAESALAYGAFIQAIIDFLIIAFTIFVIFRLIVNSERGVKKLTKKMKKQQGNEQVEQAPPPPPVKIESQEDILKDIRELLKNKVATIEETPAEAEKELE